MDLLAAPLVSSGVLYYSQPGQLARHTLQPEAAVLVVDPRQVRMFDGKRWEVIDLASKPVVRQFVESFVRILQGDAGALDKLYAMNFKLEPGAGWSLSLKPRQAPMDKLIASMVLRGDGLALQTMKIVEAGGDETVTEFSAVQTARVFTETEKQKFFPPAAR